MEKILKISLRVWSSESINDYILKIYEFQAKRTNSSYMFDGKRLSFDKLGKLGSSYDEGSAHVTEYHTYCLPEDEQECIKSIERKIRKEVVEKLSHMQNQSKLIDGGYDIERIIVE